jgi:hypothetical protein
MRTVAAVSLTQEPGRWKNGQPLASGRRAPSRNELGGDGLPITRVSSRKGSWTDAFPHRGRRKSQRPASSARPCDAGACTMHAKESRSSSFGHATPEERKRSLSWSTGNAGSSPSDWRTEFAKRATASTSPATRQAATGAGGGRLGTCPVKRPQTRSKPLGQCSCTKLGTVGPTTAATKPASTQRRKMPSACIIPSAYHLFHKPAKERKYRRPKIKNRERPRNQTSPDEASKGW